MVKIVFLGTSQAVPDAKRNQTSILVSHGSENILIDCGEGTQRQMKIARINACKITRILITHWHGDHILGIPGLLQSLAFSNYAKTLHVYGPKGTKRFMDLMLRLFIFKEKIKVQIHELEEGVFFQNKDLILESRKMKHSCPCLGYNVIEKDKRKIKINELKKIGVKPGPIIKKLQEGKNIKYRGKTVLVSKYTKIVKGKKISVILDTSYNENAVKLVKDAHLMISEACYTTEHKDLAPERGHLTAEQAAKIAKKGKVKKLILLHVSQRYKNKDVVVKEAKKTFKNTSLAKDFVKLEI